MHNSSVTPFYHGVTVLVVLIIEDSWSHSDTPYSIGFLWTSDRPNSETSTWQHTTRTGEDIHVPGRIRIHNSS
jgi:hypothetical protein